MLKRWISAGCVAAVALAVPAVVSAQTTRQAEPASSRRPYRGLFGGSPDAAARQSLVVSASLYGAYNDNNLDGLSQEQPRTSWLRRSGTYWGASGAIGYTLSMPGERFSFFGSSGAQLQYRNTAESNLTPSYNGALRLDARLTRSTTLGASESVSYASNYTDSFSSIDGADFDRGNLFTGDPDFEQFPLRTLRTATGLTISQRLGRATALSGTYQFRTLEVDEDDIQEGETSRFRDYRAQSGALRIMHSRRLTSNAALVLGYGVRVAESGGATADPPVMHDLNAGVNYSRALSFSRRTSFSFATGSTIVVTEQLQVPDSKRRTLFRLLGNANLVHELGRTWTARLSYDRGLVTRDGFSDLFFTDSVTARIVGLVARRLELSGTALWSVSTVGATGQDGYNNTSVAAQATFGLTKYLGFYARYIYSRSEYGDDLALDSRFARGLERQGVVAGLTTSVPLIK